MRGRSVLIAIAGVALVLVVVWMRPDEDRRRTAVPSDPPASDARREASLVAPASGDSATSVRNSVPEAATPVEVVEPRSAAGKSIEVRVVASEGGRPLEGARVLAFEQSARVELTTGESGRCTLRVPEALECVPLAAEAPGFLHACGCHEIRDEITLTLSPTTVLAGRLLASDTERPVAGAVVRQVGDCDHREPPEARTRQDGRFELAAVPLRAPVDLWIEAEGFPEQLCRLELRTEAPRAEVDVRLQRGVEISGRVIDFETRAGIPGASISGIATDATGAFRGALLVSEERADVVVEATGHCLLMTTLTREQITAPLEFVLPRGAVVEGIVRDAGGNPVVGAGVTVREDVHARIVAERAGVAREATPLDSFPKSWRYYPEGHHASARSDENGRFRIANALPWRPFLVVGASAEGRGDARVPLEPSVGLGEVRTVELVLEAPTEGFVHITFLLNGQPLRTASGRVRWRGAKRSGEGEFESGDLYESVELGEVSFELELDGLPPSIEGARFSMQVEASTRNVRQIELHLPTRSITGRVTFEDGPPAALATVTASAPTRRAGEHYWDRLHVSTKAGDDGAYTLEVPDLAAPFRVEASLDNDERALEGIRAGASGVDLVLARSGSLLFRFRNAESGELLDALRFELGWKRVSAEDFAPLYLGWPLAPDPEGWYEQRLPAGRLDLRASERFGRAEHYRSLVVEDVQLDPQGPRRVEFAMTPGKVVELRLAPGVEPWPREQRVLFVEANVWDDVQYSKENNSWEGGSLGSAILQRFVHFDENGEARIRGLAPGRFRFKAFPDELVLEPAELLVGEEPSAPVVVRWQRR